MRTASHLPMLNSEQHPGRPREQQLSTYASTLPMLTKSISFNAIFAVLFISSIMIALGGLHNSGPSSETRKNTASVASAFEENRAPSIVAIESVPGKKTLIFSDEVDIAAGSEGQVLVQPIFKHKAGEVYQYSAPVPSQSAQ